jgi:hypothetical protein
VQRAACDEGARRGTPVVWACNAMQCNALHWGVGAGARSARTARAQQAPSCDDADAERRAPASASGPGIPTPSTQPHESPLCSTSPAGHATTTSCCRRGPPQATQKKLLLAPPSSLYSRKQAAEKEIQSASYLIPNYQLYYSSRGVRTSNCSRDVSSSTEWITPSPSPWP